MLRVLPALLFAVVLVLGPLHSPAAAVSIDELFNLKANGLSEEVLIALIESDGSVFHLTSEDVLALHKRGLGEKVILAMLATARRAAPVMAAPAAPPTVVVAPVVHVQPPAPIEQSVEQHVNVAPPDPVYVQVPVAVPVPVVVSDRPVHAAKPVYWGFGGRLRPGSWKPAPDQDAKR
jgi:hypothetical protein